MKLLTPRFSAAIVMLCVLAMSPVWAEEPPKAKETAASVAAADLPNTALLDPSKATERAPDAFRVKLETTKGDVLILVNRAWAPNGADRFYNLVKIGYFTDVAFYRAVSGFMVQCGFHGDPDVTAMWSRATIDDDEMEQSNKRGMVTFAQPGIPNARTTQFFINTTDNEYLKKHGKFAPFGKVLSGMDVVASFYTGYGEGAPHGQGPSQSRIAREGNEYLRKDFPKLDYIKAATFVETPE